MTASQPRKLPVVGKLNEIVSIELRLRNVNPRSEDGMAGTLKHTPSRPQVTLTLSNPHHHPSTTCSLRLIFKLPETSSNISYLFAMLRFQEA